MRRLLLFLNVALVTTALLTTVHASPNGETTQPQISDVLLPTYLYPVYYDLELQPFMYSGSADSFSFRGHVKIVLDCKEATDVVTLHVKNLTISSVTMTSLSLGYLAPAVTSWQEELEREFLHIHLGGELKEGKRYMVALNFMGPLKDDLKGLYLSSYERENQIVYLATTQLQPTSARKVFPCFDEPAIKSYFNVTLIRPDYLSSLSNTLIRDSPHTWTEDGINWVADVYHTTPKMSTYLLAFVISDFDCLTATTANHVTYRVWARPESIEQARYALDVGVRVLTFFENYYNTPYPLPKQDMIAVPDFSAGAMENWGLIIYRETYMLYQPSVSSATDRQNVAIVVAHELAHQWFGNLVTLSWWDDLWLNEGFASYMENVGVDHVHPDWRMFDQYVKYRHEVFDVDGLVTSHPIYVPVYDPVKIDEIFDDISYKKGSCIIAMMKHFLGEYTFKTGLSNYLSEKAYGAAVHDDLWNAMTEQAMSDEKDLDVKSIMDTWILQMNYPVVTLIQTHKDNVMVTQTRYLRDKSATDPGKYTSPFNYTWDVPVTLTSSEERSFSENAEVHWLWKSDPNLIIHLPGRLPDLSTGRGGWILGNVLQHGYYRVNYAESNWLALCEQLKKAHEVIHPINRAQIIDDAWNLVRGNYLSIEIAVRTIEYLHRELDFVPWKAAGAQLYYVDTMLSKTDLYEDFKKFMRSKIQKPFTTVGMDNTGASHTESFQRSELAWLACTYDDPTCLREAKSQFKQWMKEPQQNPIDASLKSTVYCTVMRHGGEEEWNFAFSQYKMSDVASEKMRLRSAMACSEDTSILNRYLNLALNPDEIRKQDALNVIISISRNIVGRDLAWAFFKRNWDRLLTDYGASAFAFSYMIGTITSSFNTEAEWQELNTFITEHPDQGPGERAFQQALERTRSNIDWMEKNKNILGNWLSDQNL